MSALGARIRRMAWVSLEAWWVITVFVVLAIVYLWPASRGMFSGSGEWVSQVLGHGGDEIPMPLYIEWVRKLPELSLASLFNPSLYISVLGAPQGTVVWMPYIERIIALVVRPWADAEQTVVLIMLGLYLFAGVTTYYLGRALMLSRSLSLAFAIAFTFTPYMYWRSFQHLALAGIFGFSSLLLGFIILDRARSAMQFVAGSILLGVFFLSGHYMVLIGASLLPVGYLWLAWKKPWLDRLRFLACFLPILGLLLWMKTNPQLGVSDLRTHPTTYTTARPVNPNARWDVLVYSAQAIDYLTGNFDERALELNPLRRWISDVVRQRHRGNFYAQEHSVGIRWLVLILFATALAQWRSFGPATRRVLILGLAVAGFAFWLSLSPRSLAPFGIGIGPSRWVHAIVPEMRAPNRWGAMAHLGVLIVAFAALQVWLSRFSALNRRVVSLSVLAFILLEAPPSLEVPTQPRSAALEPGPCTRLMVLPYQDNSKLETYRLLKSFRAFPCELVNAQQTPEVDLYLTALLGGLQWMDKPEDIAEAKRLATCLGITEVLVNDATVRSRVCEKLGGIVEEGGLCRLRSLGLPEGDWRQCFIFLQRRGI